MKKLEPPFEDLNPHDKHLAYCAMDTMMTYELYDILNSKLIPPHRQTYEFERSLLAPVMTMMKRGFRIDMAKRDEALLFCRDKVSSLTSTLDSLTEAVFGHKLNCRSHIQLKKLFYQLFLNYLKYQI